jgi:hypothetical protein
MTSLASVDTLPTRVKAAWQVVESTDYDALCERCKIEPIPPPLMQSMQNEYVCRFDPNARPLPYTPLPPLTPLPLSPPLLLPLLPQLQSLLPNVSRTAFCAPSVRIPGLFFTKTVTTNKAWWWMVLVVVAVGLAAVFFTMWRQSSEKHDFVTVQSSSMNKPNRVTNHSLNCNLNINSRINPKQKKTQGSVVGVRNTRGGR